MTPYLFVAAVLCGQASPQQPYSAPPAAPQPQMVYAVQAAPPAPTTMLVQYAAPAAYAAPSVLVSSPPLWDRAMLGMGRALIARSGKHQHARSAQLITATPTQATFAAVPQQTYTIQLQPQAVPPQPHLFHAPPQPSAQQVGQIGAVPTPPGFQPAQPPVVLIPDPTTPLLPLRFFGQW